MGFNKRNTIFKTQLTTLQYYIHVYMNHIYNSSM